MMKYIWLFALVVLGGCATGNNEGNGGPTSRATPKWLEFEHFQDQYIYLRGTINGQETDMVLDSGAGITVIDASLAKQLGVTMDDSVNVTGVGGTVKSQLARGLEISVGNLNMSDMTAAIVDLSIATKALGRPMPVILGTEVFMNSIVDIDYPNNRVAFMDRWGHRYKGDGATLELKALGHGLHAVRMDIEGIEDGWFQVDTGSGNTIDICAPFAEKHNMLADRSLKSRSVSGGIGGLLGETHTSLKTIKLGGYELQDVPASFPDANENLFAGREFDGNLGSGVLGRFRMICDFGSGLMYLEPSGDTLSREFERNHAGLFAMVQNEKLEVIFVAPGSPAEKAGWKKGMVITAIDGEAGTAGELQSRIRQRIRDAVGTTLELRDGDGKASTIELARYF